MTEYWVSQGNKWCDFCKIFISNNPSSIRNHELGTRHKEAVGKRLDDVRKNNAAKEKEQKAAVKALEQIEAKAKKSYQKDVATFQEARESNLQAFEGSGNEWEYDSSTGYHYNRSNGFYYDPNSGFYYCDTLGKWVGREEALASPHYSSASKQLPAPSTKSETADAADSLKSGPAPGRVVSAPLNPLRNVKGKQSSIAVAKRKRDDEKPKAKQKPVSAEEAAALKAREAAKKRVQDREAPLLGLYRP
uniref:Matrin-type domain-containing protein n=1 Tax=Kalanchoe fedtschenkoi TaxID=63787 RepID=A0A7N0ZR72_KALFE